jgi:hypothetical protein
MTPNDIVLRAERFVVLRVPPADASRALADLARQSDEFAIATREADGLSLVLDEATAASMAAALEHAERERELFRVITFVPALPWTVVGFFAKVTTMLAREQIPLGAVAAYARDHLFFGERFAERALAILHEAAAAGELP